MNVKVKLFEKRNMRNPKILCLKEGSKIRNASHTGDDHPNEGTWLEYWKEHTKEAIPLVCPFCGKLLIEGPDVDGCHIRYYDDKGFISRNEYIIPGHHRCNCQFQQDFVLKKSVNAVEVENK